MYKFVRRLLFLIPPEFSHHFALVMLKICYGLGLSHFLVGKTTAKPIKVLGLDFKNYLGIAAGLDKNGDYIDCLASLNVGFIEVGAITPQPQPGNPKPRLFRITSKEALINLLGFNNKGVDYIVTKLKNRKSSCIVGVNIGKNRTTPLERAKEDYLICLEKIYPYADFATINVSSPNTPGLRDLQNERLLNELLQAIQEQRKTLSQKFNKHLPILLKISPDITQEEALIIANIAREYHIDGIIATNTSQQRPEIAGEKHSEESGGLSGPPIAALSRQVLQWLHESGLCHDMILISVGGIDSKAEAAKRLQHGAQLIQVYTGLIYHGPALIKQLLNSAKLRIDGQRGINPR